jgi:hypothetical protein
MKVKQWFIDNKWLCLIMIIGGFLRFFHLDFQSPWLDEIHTLNESNPNFSFKEVYESLLISEPHPPLYFFVVYVFFKIFGYSIFIARLFSALIGFLSLYSIYLLGKELFSKKVGIYATLLLSVNYFHIYYSQEARMYVLLFFTTTISFYFLSKLIKGATIKNTVLFILTSTLMIYSHFFAIFTLFSQYLVLLYFIIFPFNTTRIKFFKSIFISGILTVLLYLPTYELVLRTTEMKSIWIQMPDIDVYTQFFKDFFGQSEMILFFIIPLLLIYLVKLFNLNKIENYTINPKKHKFIFSFIVLFTWISITLLVPLIRTYTSLPILVNRYFINILPAILVILAVGLLLIKNKIIRNGFIIIIFMVSLSDIFIVKNYYNKKTKTQFREVTSFVNANNIKNEPIVTSLGWYLPYFINNNNQEIIDKSLDIYVAEMQSSRSKIKAFWYIDGFGKTFAPQDKTKLILDSLFVVENNIDLYDIYTKHFQLKKDYNPKINFDKFKPIKQNNGNNINSSIEYFSDDKDIVNFSGWAYFDNQSMEHSKIYLILYNETQKIIIPSEKVIREDVTSYFKSDFDLSNSGFKASFFKNNIVNGNYDLLIYVKDELNKKEGLILTDKKIIINNKN